LTYGTALDEVDNSNNASLSKIFGVCKEKYVFLTYSSFLSRSEFPKDFFFAPYVPIFSSGWVPPPIPSMESEPHVLAAAIQGQADHVQRAEEAWKAGGANVSSK